jgi:hypothetical protein
MTRGVRIATLPALRICSRSARGPREQLDIRYLLYGPRFVGLALPDLTSFPQSSPE